MLHNIHKFLYETSYRHFPAASSPCTKAELRIRSILPPRIEAAVVS